MRGTSELVAGLAAAARDDGSPADRRDQDTRDWVGVVVGGFQTRAGRSLEDAVAGTLRVALLNRRGSRKPLRWEKFARFLRDHPLPKPLVVPSVLRPIAARP